MQIGCMHSLPGQVAAGRCRASTACHMQPVASLLRRQPRQLPTSGKRGAELWHDRRPGRIVCMAEPRRVARVSKQLEREIGNLFLYDKVLQKAICPERRRGLDSAASAIASVTEVRISSDLQVEPSYLALNRFKFDSQVAKVYLSVFSDAQGKSTAMDQLVRLQGYVRKKIGASMKLRLTPEIRFIYDEANERGERVLKLLKQIKLQEQGLVEPPPIAVPRPSAPSAQLEEDDTLDNEDGSEADDSDEDEETEGFFDEEVEEDPLRGDSPSAFGRPKGLAISADSAEEPDQSFFGFEDPGGWLDEDSEAADDETNERLLQAAAAANDDSWLESQGTAGEQKSRKRATRTGGSRRR